MNMKYTRLLTFAATAVLLTGLASAQPPCDPNKVYPNGLDIRHLSRDINGVINMDTTSKVYFQICNLSGVKSRITLNQPFTMNINVQTGCDEVPELKGKLVGRYRSTLRMVDPYTNNVKNTRVGFHTVRGDILVPDPTGADMIVGQFSMQGTIGTNTSRPPMPLGIGRCFECGHHEGLLIMRFNGKLPQLPMTAQAQTVYQFETFFGTMDCDQVDPCITQWDFMGTLDGVVTRVCNLAAGDM